MLVSGLPLCSPWVKSLSWRKDHLCGQCDPSVGIAFMLLNRQQDFGSWCSAITLERKVLSSFLGTLVRCSPCTQEHKPSQTLTPLTRVTYIYISGHEKGCWGCWALLPAADLPASPPCNFGQPVSPLCPHTSRAGSRETRSCPQGLQASNTCVAMHH